MTIVTQQQRMQPEPPGLQKYAPRLAEKNRCAWSEQVALPVALVLVTIKDSTKIDAKTKYRSFLGMVQLLSSNTKRMKDPPTRREHQNLSE